MYKSSGENNEYYNTMETGYYSTEYKPTVVIQNKGETKVIRIQLITYVLDNK